VKEKLKFASLLALLEVHMSMQSTHLCEDIHVSEKERDFRSFAMICAFAKLSFRAWAYLGAISSISMNVDV
jgi:hypothetical protein